MSWEDDAFNLLKLLEMYCQSQDEWEEHYDKLFDKQFTKKQEEADHKRLLEEATRPVIHMAAKAGYGFDILMDIIPGNFSTNSEQRYAILAELREWVDEELEVPF